MATKITPRIVRRMHGYTTRQLEEYIQQQRWDLESVSLKETRGGLFWMGKQVPLRRFPMYLSPEDPRRRASVTKTVQEYSCERDPAAKQVWLSYGCFYRSPGTKGNWFRIEQPHYITLCDASAWVEILKLDRDRAVQERYELTADPQAEDISFQEFEYVRHLGMLTITGVCHYCERLHIPAQLDGMPVANVFLSNGVDAPYLRELSVEEGVRKLDFVFGRHELAEIRIPPSVQLVRSPDGIRSTAWFRNQPDGPVYFQGYYCGTKGVPETDHLTLRDGTVGVTRWADEQLRWKKIQLPASLTYISSSSFSPYGCLEEVACAGASEQLKAYFRILDPFLIQALRQQRRSGGFERLPEPLTGRLLYELGRNSKVVRQQIPWEWLPTAPRLRYEKGWIGEFWYCVENSIQPDYYAAFYLPSGEPIEVRKLDKNPHAPFSSFWTEDYLPPEYLMAEDYLDCCAAAVGGGEPTDAILEQLNAWWESLMPREVLNYWRKTDHIAAR